MCAIFWVRPRDFGAEILDNVPVWKLTLNRWRIFDFQWAKQYSLAVQRGGHFYLQLNKNFVYDYIKDMDWIFKRHGDTISVDADISIRNASEFCAELESEKPSALELSALTVEDGESMALIISAIRRMQPICLLAAPQMLAHGLYKIGALSHGGIELVRPRADEGQGA